VEARCFALTTSGRTIQDFGLADKIAVITGGGSGIGQAIAIEFAAHGAKIRILDLSEQQAAATRETILNSGGDASVHACDVTSQAQVREQLDSIFRRERVHILVNNAGISHIGTVESTTEEDFDRVMRVNVKGFYNCTHSTVAHMKANGGGVILNMASTAGSSGIADRFAYSTSKGAVIAMTYSVARDYLAHGIRCNCISPARVHTPFVDGYLAKHYPGREREMFETLAKSQPIGRMAEPQEVAKLALFLCSDESSFVTGVDYPIDGGFFNLRG
jgi:2-keto-3-deoxy-L-fuconate dehydrogenase